LGIYCLGIPAASRAIQFRGRGPRLYDVIVSSVKFNNNKKTMIDHEKVKLFINAYNKLNSSFFCKAQINRSTGILTELYIDTIQNCGMFLLKENDEVIKYAIFEEFDIGVVSFFHDDSLIKLLNAGLISYEEMKKSVELRKIVFELQQRDKWNLEALKNFSIKNFNK
jgi:hypothetical protein